MYRRKLIHTIASVPVLLSGCISNVDRYSGTDNSSQGDRLPLSESIQTDQGWSLSVTNTRVRKCVIQTNTVHSNPACGQGTQYLLVDVETSGSDAPSASTLNIGFDFAGKYIEAQPLDSRSNQKSMVATYAVTVDVSSAPSGATIVWQGERDEQARWAVPKETVTKLSSSPEFHIESFEAPDTAADGQEVEVLITVANQGDRDGRFIAELGDAALSDQPEISIEVKKGESVTEIYDIEVNYLEEEKMVLVLKSSGVYESQTITPPKS
ncbi:MULTISPECIES: hypothetical protein [unclassified Haloferax]|uniref:hypothetical protein n=1 Tax=unclassified Haloferax TaxID=2625095 RepID=UPI00287489C0|nr:MULTISPECIES: hypothetical protein [unclassified Haloferax]MDS0242248.1 hypothetical protein [Haloferax sp. S2CR25]MDS0445369.1 hypothetical protein [Haloferax sp. S2CR25-2]